MCVVCVCVYVCLFTTNIKNTHYLADRPTKGPATASRFNAADGSASVAASFGSWATFARAATSSAAAVCGQGSHHNVYVARTFLILLHTHAMTDNTHLHIIRCSTFRRV